MSSPPARYFARLTPPGRGAVAVIQVAGPDAAEAVDRFLKTRSGKPLASWPVGRIAFGKWDAPGESAAEELIALRRSAAIVEVQCHGGDAAVERIEDSLRSLGFEKRTWTDAIAAASRGPTQAAACLLPRALTLRTAAILLDQASGALACELRSICQQIDLREISRATSQIDRLLDHLPLGLHLADYWRVAIAGAPNVGKSSLLNALVGFRRAIVHDQPGTTRDALTARTASDGWPIEFIDTAGLRETADPLEAAGIARAREAAAQADLVLLVRDASRAIDAFSFPSVWPAAMIPVWNKGDLVEKGWLPPAIAGEAAGLVVSAATGQGIAELLAAIVERLIPATPAAGEGLPITINQGEALAQAAEALRAGDAPSARRLLGDLFDLRS